MVAFTISNFVFASAKLEAEYSTLPVYVSATSLSQYVSRFWISSPNVLIKPDVPPVKVIPSRPAFILIIPFSR